MYHKANYRIILLNMIHYKMPYLANILVAVIMGDKLSTIIYNHQKNKGGVRYV